MIVRNPPAANTLNSWAIQQRKLRQRQFQPQFHGIRFAFYGRMSTVDFQDKASSSRWQRSYAEELVADHGRIVAEYFDEGVSRRVAWPDRPQASLLLAAVTDPARGFEAIVVGEFERAFTASNSLSLLQCYRGTASSCGCRKPMGPLTLTIHGGSR